MKESESKVLEAAAILYNAIPGYLAQTESKQQMGHYLVDLIDALDDIEYSRSGTPLYDIIGGSAPGRRKKAILTLEKEYGLTERESHILRYLANERNPTYIANALGISPSTAKAHKYSIFKKLGVHTSEELKAMLEHSEAHPAVGCE
ncbi:helix-turn-helix transcriptional regulator [Raoultibacter massiliensis]|uniref:Helix-turn-helix transcriptional regulator n=1 Tax=Raoultibacter massiliensis TaxID=1852371 RepID=A0ABV1JE31_9ACTN|nr:helix-turn-helix transcriptional regulator [Raoultibacter massiliensis]